MNSLDEGVWRCRHLCKKNEGSSFSLANPPGIAVFLRDMDIDWRAKTKVELLRYYVVSLEKEKESWGANAMKRVAAGAHHLGFLSLRNAQTIETTTVWTAVHQSVTRAFTQKLNSFHGRTSVRKKD